MAGFSIETVSTCNGTMLTIGTSGTFLHNKFVCKFSIGYWFVNLSQKCLFELKADSLPVLHKFPI